MTEWESQLRRGDRILSPGRLPLALCTSHLGSGGFMRWASTRGSTIFRRDLTRAKVWPNGFSAGRCRRGARHRTGSATGGASLDPAARAGFPGMKRLQPLFPDTRNLNFCSSSSMHRPIVRFSIGSPRLELPPLAIPTKSPFAVVGHD